MIVNCAFRVRRVQRFGEGQWMPLLSMLHQWGSKVRMQNKLGLRLDDKSRFTDSFTLVCSHVRHQAGSH